MKHVDIPKRSYAVKVERFEKIRLRCLNRACPDPVFTASFDEAQRTLACPSCKTIVEIPEAYRGLP